MPLDVSYRLAVGGAVDRGCSQQVKSARRVENLAAVASVAQTVVSMLD